MNMLLCSSIILLLLPACLCVTVTLEGGSTGTFSKDLLLGTTGLLNCSYSRGSAGNSTAEQSQKTCKAQHTRKNYLWIIQSHQCLSFFSVQWTYSKTDGFGSQKLINYKNQIQEEFSQRFSIQQLASLQIQSAVKNDTGFYECRVTIPNDGVGTGTYNLTILIPPSKPVCQFTSDYALTIGFNAEFKCHSSEAIPSPIYTWYKNGVALPTSSANDSVYSNTTFSYNMENGTLTFANVTKADVGVYYCEAENDNGKSQCSSVNITIIPPSKPACQFTSDYALTIGFSAEFKCHSAEAIPSPMYTWYKNGVALPTSSANDSIYSNTTFSYNMETGTLIFANVTEADAGVYYCEAENNNGKSQCSPVSITTKEQDVRMIIGIIFGLLLVGVLIWWASKMEYCDGRGGKDDKDGVDGDDANNIMLDGHGPMVELSSEYNGSTGKVFTTSGHAVRG